MTHPTRKTKVMFGKRYRNCIKKESTKGESINVEPKKTDENKKEEPTKKEPSKKQPIQEEKIEKIPIRIYSRKQLEAHTNKELQKIVTMIGKTIRTLKTRHTKAELIHKILTCQSGGFNNEYISY